MGHCIPYLGYSAQMYVLSCFSSSHWAFSFVSCWKQMYPSCTLLSYICSLQCCQLIIRNCRQHKYVIQKLRNLLHLIHILALKRSQIFDDFQTDHPVQLATLICYKWPITYSCTVHSTLLSEWKNDGNIIDHSDDMTLFM